MSLNAAAVIPAAGAGRRMGGVRKAFLELGGVPILQRSIEAFLSHPAIRQVVIALAEDDVADPPEWLRQPSVTLVRGGAERHESVRHALAAVRDDIDLVAIHDAARPLVDAALITRVLETAATGVGAIAALPASDTIHEVNDRMEIVQTPPRERLFAAQTPQAFPLRMIRDAHARAAADHLQGTDDAAIAARYGYVVKIVPGEPANLKVTLPQDLAVAELFLAARRP